MATYVYETIPQKPGDTATQFELQQSMRDAALTTHPETGVPVRRIITGGYGLIGANTGRSGEGASTTPAAAPAEASHSHGGGGCCGGSCGCKH
ncbi:MAG: zinc ribbon domain-containing protein [Opitutaceae bacterium]|nr:zinc ribbon domain-containing protein [Opitutaceae bacterium]